MRKLWNALRRPSARWSVLALVAIGIVIGIALIVLPHVGIKVTSTTEFCVSCHSMQPVYEEYKQSVHFQNASGVRAECHDCHIPPDIPGMVKRKLEASNDIYQTFIAHQLPDMSSGFRKQFDELRASANDSGDTLYSIDIKPIYAAKGDKEASGSLLPASEVKVLKRDGDWLQIEITGWTESAGRQRVLTQFPGKRIFVASIRGDVQQQVKTLEKTTVADTNTEWSKLQATAWMKKGDMVNDIKPIWAYADSLYNGTCNECHGAPEIAHFDANGWIGTLNGMIGFTSLDKREERTLLKYLQMNASDTAGKAHGDKKEEK
ncbi:NapC/NirT family cytochrome c [Shigella flexneri]